MTEAGGVMRLRADAVSWREVEGEALVLDLRTSTYLAANPTSTVLWHALDAGTTRTDLVAALVARFGIAEERAERSVDAFLAECRRRDLLDEDDREPPAGRD